MYFGGQGQGKANVIRLTRSARLRDTHPPGMGASQRQRLRQDRAKCVQRHRCLRAIVMTNCAAAEVADQASPQSPVGFREVVHTSHNTSITVRDEGVDRPKNPQIRPRTRLRRHNLSTQPATRKNQLNKRDYNKS
jgi:hypothetical protein